MTPEIFKGGGVVTKKTEKPRTTFASLEWAAEYAIEHELPEGGFKIVRVGSRYMLRTGATPRSGSAGSAGLASGGCAPAGRARRIVGGRDCYEEEYDDAE